MNKCHFLGRFTKDLIIGTDGKTPVLYFTLAITRKFKKSGTGELGKQVYFLDFEAWDTGAQTIARDFQKGDPIIVYSSARSYTYEKDGKKNNQVVFRVESFDYIPYPKRHDITEEPPFDVDKK
jgi:single-stranded DNA-binding protein